MARITIDVAPDGTSTMEVKGVKGTSCVDLTKPFEDAIGGEVLSDEKTREYQERPNHVRANTQTVSR